MQRLTRQRVTLALLLCAIIGVVVWSQWPAPNIASATLAAGEVVAQAQASPQSESPLPATPTPLAPMPTPQATIAVGDDWQTFSSPYWGVSFQYPPGWELDKDPYDNGWDRANVDDEAMDWRPGYPISLSSPNAEDGPIWIILNYYRLSESGSLAEWFELNQIVSRYDAMIPPNDEPYVISDAYLPQDVDQAIFAIDSTYPIMPSYSVWFTGNGLVFTMRSAYNRPNNIPNLLAILSTVKFESIPAERLTATNSFFGDENTLREKIAQVEAEMANYCNTECEQQKDYNMRMEALYYGMIQPPRDRPMMQAFTPALDDGSWQTYTQTVMGISFRYPADSLFIIDPFVENGLDESSLLSTSLIIKDSFARRTVLEIEISPYAVSPDVPLHNWEAIQDQIDRALHPENQFRYRMPVPFYHEHVPQESDDIVQTRQQAAYYQLDTFWASKDGVVYRFTNNDLSVLWWAAGIFATLEFDTGQIAKLRDMDVFLGDERDMVDELAALWDRPPTPTPDPASTATPYPTATPTVIYMPSPTPTPVMVTVTPSAFESPLKNGLARYQGKTQYEGMSPYEIYYDPTKWQLSRREGEEETDYSALLLVHQHLINCSINLNSWYAHAIGLDSVSLANREWGIGYLGNNTLGYGTHWERGSRSFTISLPEPIRIPYDPTTKTLCELEAEAIFDTLVVLDQTSQGILMPTVTPMPN